MRERYAAQVRLLIRLIPFVAEHTDFALKGGTAINLFYRNLPRYSVDIDLVYLPNSDRDSSLKGIATELEAMAETIRANSPDLNVSLVAGGGNQDTRILVRSNDASVKIEVSPVTRGTLFPPETQMVHEVVEEEFGFAEMQVVTFEELFAGKIVAALDRSHPRDLFDVHHLLTNEGISDDLFRTFLIYLASSSRPMHELLNPKPKDIEDMYRREFEGMTKESLGPDVLNDARENLIQALQSKLRGNAAEFLTGLHDCAPDFSLIGLPQAEDLPAIKWKLRNLERFKKEQPKRHLEQADGLKELFG